MDDRQRKVHKVPALKLKNVSPHCRPTQVGQIALTVGWYRWEAVSLRLVIAGADGMDHHCK